MSPAGGATSPGWLAAEALPECLRAMPRPPDGLWYLGDPEALLGAPARHVAIVGTREASDYGLRTAEHLAAACAAARAVVVSGMARGIDAAAHRAVLRQGGATIAVQGTGVDVPYPAGHRSLHVELAERGTVLSEMEPGTRATPGCFPRRNRIIAGLCEVTVVVEAGFKSGAINTASQALELGRVVAAVPGRIDDPRASGCNILIRDGAQVVTGVEDLLTLLGLSTPAERGATGPRSRERSIPADLTPLERRAIDALELGESLPDDLATTMSVPVRQVLGLLSGLELRGLVEQGAGRARLTLRSDA
jgi:DNA processing protein